LQDLLALKQQQASIIEARMALVRADLSINQGRSIMLFTIVTICFLPLSFFASIFGMNNQEMNGSAMTVRDQLTYMCKFTIHPLIYSSKQKWDKKQALTLSNSSNITSSNNC
jgi:Mg2+ and Co2+ transporter CorA